MYPMNTVDRHSTLNTLRTILFFILQNKIEITNTINYIILVIPI